MVENLLAVDQNLFLKLNHWASPGFDPVMLFLSSPTPWLLLILVVVIVMLYGPVKRSRKENLFILIALALAWGVGDLLSVHLFKEVFERLRPCHEPSLAHQVRLVAESCGGQYGFVSSHATNAFSLALLSSLVFRQRWFTLGVFAWALVVCYSRIYIGVHYPGDVIGGMFLGLLTGFIIYLILRMLIPHASRITRHPSRFTCCASDQPKKY